MSELARVQVFYKPAADVPSDGFSNTLYWRFGDIIGGGNYQELAEDVRDVYNANVLGWGGMTYDIRAYNNADPKHSPPKARITGTFTGTTPDLGPREVALCLSYRTDPPYTSSRRGRIYTGPWAKQNCDERPRETLRAAVIAMGEDFASIGGEDISWRLYSPTTDEDHHIRHIWVDDAWDTVRGRGQAPTTRSSANV